ncbi:MAG: GNAT family N-acetyltransferase [Bacteroidales bacterium]|nr:GNAT family N-acetyltransferase [Bacteroidales bacterium]
MYISSRQLIFNKLTDNDFTLYAQLTMNDDVMKFVTGNALTLEKAEIRFQKVLDTNIASGDTGFFIVRKKDKDDFIGIVKLVQITADQFEVGYMLLPEYWGKGYASEMVKCMISLATKKQIKEIIGIVDPENPASIRVLSKFGFQLYETGKFDGLKAAFYKLEFNKTMPLTNNE